MNGVQKHTTELQTCPNCGDSAKLHKTGQFGKVWYECDGDCWTQTDKYWNEKDARAEWNSIKPRAKEFLIDEHRISQLEEELRDLIDYDEWSAREYGENRVDYYCTAINLIKAGYRKVED